MSLTLRRSCFGLCALSVLLTTSGLRAADLAPTDRLLPPNVLLYVSIPDVTEAQTRWSDTGFGQLTHDPAMADLNAFLMEKFEEASREVEDELGMPLSDIFSLPSGEAAFALLQPPGQQIGGLLFVNTGDHKDILDKLLDRFDEEIQNEATKSTDEFDGTEITIYEPENAPPNNPIKSICYFVKDGMLVAGSDVSLLESVLVRWDGDHDRTFAEDKTYEYIYERCQKDADGDPSLVWFVNPIGLFKAGMSAAGPEVAMQSAMVMGFLPVLGLDRLKGMGGTSELATEDFDMVSRSVLYVEQPASGVLRVFRCPPADVSPADFIPAQVTNVSGINWDVEGAYEAVGQTWDFFTSPGTFDKIMDDAEDDPDGPGIHPKEDFIDLLSGGIHMIQDFPKGGDIQQQRMAFLFDLKDEGRMQEVIARVMNMDGADVNEREFRGVTIYEPDTGPGQQPFTPAIAVAKGHLFITLNTELLESLLRGNDGESLANSPEFREMIKWMPKQVSTFSFARQADVFEMLYAAFKQGALQDAGDDFDPDLLPDFEALRKYFGNSASYAVPDENGVYMESFSLKMSP